MRAAAAHTNTDARDSLCFAAAAKLLPLPILHDSDYCTDDGAAHRQVVAVQQLDGQPKVQTGSFSYGSANALTSGARAEHMDERLMLLLVGMETYNDTRGRDSERRRNGPRCYAHAVPARASGLPRVRMLGSCGGCDAVHACAQKLTTKFPHVR